MKRVSLINVIADMKMLCLALVFSLFIVGCSSSSDEFIGPKDPSKITLKMNKSEVSLEYLQRDTLLVNGVDTSQVKWYVAEGDSCVTMLGNVVVARRKGTARIMAKAGEEWGEVKVNVTTENYVPVERIIVDVNGKQYKIGDIKHIMEKKEEYGNYDVTDNYDYLPGFVTGDTVISYTAEKLHVKVVGYEPANATYPVAYSMNFTDRIGGQFNYGIWGSEYGAMSNGYCREWVFDIQAIRNLLKVDNVDEMTFSGKLTELSGFTFRNLYCESDYPNSSFSYRLSLFLELWPRDLEKTQYDITEIGRVKEELQKSWPRRKYLDELEYRLAFEHRSDPFYINGSDDRDIYLKAGETRQLVVERALKEFSGKEWFSWSEEIHKSYLESEYNPLKITSDGIVSLDAAFTEFIDSCDDREYNDRNRAFLGSLCVRADPKANADAYNKILQDPWKDDLMYNFFYWREVFSIYGNYRDYYVVDVYWIR